MSKEVVPDIRDPRLFSSAKAPVSVCPGRPATEDRRIEGLLQPGLLQVGAGLLYDCDDLLVAIRSRDVIHAQVCKGGRQPASKRNGMQDALAYEIRRKPGLRLDKPQLEVPSIFSVLILRMLSVPARCWIHLVVDELPRRLALRAIQATLPIRWCRRCRWRTQLQTPSRRGRSRSVAISESTLSRTRPKSLA